ncbi:hypothetical protein [Spirillospora sp. CA-294931]|uniref:hypothetical protein n=1 Tax=Spirillospora sp. CA-294931 TaxID=3240042 RepID=UPI003D8DA481
MTDRITTPTTTGYATKAGSAVRRFPTTWNVASRLRTIARLMALTPATVLGRSGARSDLSPRITV